ncbi:MAG: cytochrome c [bacterium]
MQPQGGLPDTNAITPEMVNGGRDVFRGPGTCFACHGTKLEGGPIAPTLKPHAWKDAKEGTLAAIFQVVTHGVKGTAMVSHPGGISDADAVRVATYVWSVGHRGAKP